MLNKTKFNFWLDLILCAVFAVTVITGLLLWLVIPKEQANQAYASLGLARQSWIDVHCWAGVMTLIGSAIHIALHWKWIWNTGRRYLTAPRPARINFTLNIFLFVAFVVVNVSGLANWVSPLGASTSLGESDSASIAGLLHRSWSDDHQNARLIRLDGNDHLQLGRHNWSDDDRLGSGDWIEQHQDAGVALLAILVIHIALHYKWIVSVIRNYLCCVVVR